VPTTTADRARVQNLGIDFTALAQGVNFFHAGVDMLRSKSMDRDSFNSGDWFNRLDFTYQSNNWGVGLPVASKNQAEWPVMQPFLANPSLAPAPDDIAATATHLREMLAIKSSTPLFNLQTATDVQERVAFHNTGPAQTQGMIVMSISDRLPTDLDPGVEEIVVIFNATTVEQTFTLPATAGHEWALHPIQQLSTDPVLAGATHDIGSGEFTVPARTTAVFMTDITPPVVAASLDFVRGGTGAAWFTVGYSCADASGIAASSAEINGVPVIDGEDVHLVILDDPDATPRWKRTKKGKLTIWDFEFAFTVTCEDAHGNVGTTVVIPAFRAGPS
jgi:hypothetical protein